MFLLMFCAAMLLGKLSRFINERATLLGFFAVYIGGFVLFQRAIPRLLRLRRLEDGEKVRFPLEAVARAHAAEAKFIQEQLDHESADVEQPSWVCPKCREENPGNFDECWKCQTWRDQVSGTPSGKTE
jgi:hypothetical protein